MLRLSGLSTSTPAISGHDAEIKEQQSMWGLTRTLIQNTLTGITDSFIVPLYLVDIGYHAAALEADPRGKVE